MTTTSSPGEQADQLLDQTKDVSALNSAQVADVVNQLEKLLSSPNVSLEVGRAMVSVISNLLNASASSLGSSSKRYDEVLHVSYAIFLYSYAWPHRGSLAGFLSRFG